MLESGITTLIISTEQINDIMEIVEYFEESSLLIRGASETIQNEGKVQKYRFVSMLLGTLRASLWGNLLTVKGKVTVGEGTTRADQNF